MKRFFTWLWLLSKRQLKSIFFLIILLLIPICGLLLKQVSDSMEASVFIGIADSDKTPLSEKFTDNLNKTKGIINFVIYTDTDKMSEDILSGNLQCGYEILESFETRLSKNIYSDLLEVYSSPNSPVILLSNEIMFSKVFAELGYYTFIDDMTDSNVFTNISDEDLVALQQAYEKELKGGETFSFNYSSINGKYVSSGNIDVLDYIKTPIRGIVAVFIFMAGLAGGFTYLKDKNNGVKVKMCVFDIAIPVLFSTASGFASILLAGINEAILKEAIALICYSLVVILFVYILSKLISNNAIYCSTIPIFALGSLVCCPIFVNLKTFIPLMKLIQLLFMPTYYFMIFNAL